MATLSKGHTFSGGETVTAAKLNSLVDSATISGIVNSEIDAAAAIALSKLATGALPTGITVASANLVDGTIVNADISAAAAIAGTKIAPNFGSQNIVTTGTLSAETTATVQRGSAVASATADLILRRQRPSVAAVQNGDALGNISFRGLDGTNFINAASISALVDGTPGTNDMPGRIIFSTTADGGSSPTERMRIDSSGKVGIATSSPLSTNGGLDIASGGLGLVLGAESGSSQRSNNTSKLGRIVCPHYTNSEEPVAGIIVSSDSAANVVAIGGGSSLTNAATEINFRTASNATTTIGTIRLLIDSSGNVGVGTTTPSAAALLDVSSTTKGFLPPRMTTAQRDAISTPPAGLVIYNTSTNVLDFYNGSAWGAV